MELYQLAQFREIAECESVSQAAARLHTSQPALSAMLKKLEISDFYCIFSISYDII